MKIPSNLSISAKKNHIELQWDTPAVRGFKYEITRHTETPSFHKSVRLVQIDSDESRCLFTDNDLLDRGRVYYYTVCYLDPGELLVPKKPLRVRFQPNAPIPITELKLLSLSQKELGISWQNYRGDHDTDIDHYEIYVDHSHFRNIGNRSPQKIVSGKYKSCTYVMNRPESQIYVAVVPVDSEGKKVLGVTPAIINEPWKDMMVRDPSITFSITPVSQSELLEIVIDLAYGEPESEYHVIIGESPTMTALHTNSNGHGRATVAVPSGIGPGRHSITLDNGFGSIVTSNNILLVPMRLSPIENDIIGNTPNVIITSGFDNSIIDRIYFNDNDSVSLRFRRGSSPEELRMDICKLLGLLHSGAIVSASGPSNLHVNIPVRVLPSFNYPPFVLDANSGSLNLFGLVQQTNFDTAEDWANHINDFHRYFGGQDRVVKSILQFNSDTQQFGLGLIDSGTNYESNYPLRTGLSYLIEVKEPINNYCISADGFVTFDYLPIQGTPSGSLNWLVLVADGAWPDAESWAEEINEQHTGINRVVSSITPWSAEDQNYGKAMIDTGFQYEGNFAITPGRGYIVEVKESVSGFSITGNALTTEVC